MDLSKLVFWMLSGLMVVSLSGLWFFIQQFIKGVKQDVNLLFAKIDMLIERLEMAAKITDFKDLEHRVRECERRIDQCTHCGKTK
jgi:hypothetical protein